MTVRRIPGFTIPDAVARRLVARDGRSAQVHYYSSSSATVRLEVMDGAGRAYGSERPVDTDGPSLLVPPVWADTDLSTVYARTEVRDPWANSIVLGTLVALSVDGGSGGSSSGVDGGTP